MTKKRTPAEIERETLNDARPPSDREIEWRSQYASVVEILKQQALLSPSSPKQLKDALEAFAKALNGGLPKLRMEQFEIRYVAEALRDRAVHDAKEIMVGPSGGADRKHPYFHLKDIAAQFACYLLEDYGHKDDEPKFHVRHRSITSLLLEAAFGEKVPVKAACDRYRNVRRARMFLVNINIPAIYITAPKLIINENPAEQ
jgi:hypothetical protein